MNMCKTVLITFMFTYVYTFVSLLHLFGPNEPKFCQMQLNILIGQINVAGLFKECSL